MRKSAGKTERSNFRSWGAFNINMKRVFVTILILSWASKLIASPVLDLSSPSPETRDAAATILRATYTPPPRTNWDSLVATLKTGVAMTNIEQHLRTLNIKPNYLGDGEQLRPVEYRLDEAWILRCEYQQWQGQHPGVEALYSRKVLFSPTYFQVKMPANFTGVWTEYYINGQKFRETNMKDGQRQGDFSYYKYDGSKLPSAYIIGWGLQF